MEIGEAMEDTANACAYKHHNAEILEWHVNKIK
jgi:hypothetical protein